MRVCACVCVAFGVLPRRRVHVACVRGLTLPSCPPFQDAPGVLQLYSFTKIEWLDVMDFTITGQPGGGAVIEAHSWSSGVIPCSVPGAPLLNAVRPCGEGRGCS